MAERKMRDVDKAVDTRRHVEVDAMAEGDHSWAAL